MQQVGVEGRGLKTTRRPITVAALLLAMAMAAMEATVVATVMPTVIADLGGVTLYGWVGSTYLLASTVSVPLYGKLSDVHGRRPVLLLGIVLFLLGSIASGLSGSIIALIVARAVQGLGAGAMQPVAMTVIGDLYGIEERGKIQGAFGAVWAVSGVAGPLLGGAIVHALSWHWVFWVNVPFGIAAVFMLLSGLHEAPRQGPRPPIDWAGAGLVTCGSLALLLGASNQGGLPMIAAGLAAFAWLVRVERRAADPVLPLDLVTRRPIAVASVSTALLGAAMMGTLIYVPLYVQGVLGRTPSEAGSVLSPMLVGWPVSSAIASRLIVRTGFRAPVWLGSALTLLALVLLAWLTRGHPSTLALSSAMFCMGLGMGLTTSVLIIALQASVGWQQRGVVTATNMFARSIGGAVGVGALGAFLAARLSARLDPERVSELLAPGRHAAQVHDVGVVHALDASLVPLFEVLAVVALLNVLVVALYPRKMTEVPRDSLPAPAR